MTRINNTGHHMRYLFVIVEKQEDSCHAFKASQEAQKRLPYISVWRDKVNSQYCCHDYIYFSIFFWLNFWEKNSFM